MTLSFAKVKPVSFHVVVYPARALNTYCFKGRMFIKGTNKIEFFLSFEELMLLLSQLRLLWGRISTFIAAHVPRPTLNWSCHRNGGPKGWFFGNILMLNGFLWDYWWSSNWFHSHPSDIKDYILKCLSFGSSSSIQCHNVLVSGMWAVHNFASISQVRKAGFLWKKSIAK